MYNASVPLAPVDPRAVAYVQIRSRASNALAAGIISLFFFGIVLGPGAIIRASLVRRDIARYGVGHEFAGRAQAGMICGIIGLTLWVGMIGMAIAGAH